MLIEVFSWLYLREEVMIDRGTQRGTDATRGLIRAGRLIRAGQLPRPVRSLVPVWARFWARCFGPLLANPLSFHKSCEEFEEFEEFNGWRSWSESPSPLGPTVYTLLGSDLADSGCV